VIIIALVFLIPIWRIARSKGYNGRAFVLVAGTPAAIATAISVLLEPQSDAMAMLLMVATIGIPLLTLGLAAVLPTRPGAPGKAWLKITFPCPDCGHSLSFGRELEGLNRQCPKCDEIVTVSDKSDASPGIQ
jgi:endogenous inhibitor of DNA gyrase (YacG/DUF329 family)